ncbi:flagellar biosynthesis protein FlhF [Virgibacillus kekensis]|uniref:Flagellar biosynthesis protein FlhF n=1 Tax=Virgibacillus kekensis TaxID=202261 RepID=A0ABV9DH52_9BACI
MKVKKFVAPTMPEAMNRIRKELGSEAVILNSKEIYQGGFLGMFKKRNIEVIAALDPQPGPPPAKQEPVKTQVPAKNPGNDDNQHILNEIRQLKQVVELQSKQNPTGYSADFQVMYNYLTSQEVDEGLARDLIDSISEDRDSPKPEGNLLAGVKNELKKRLAELPFQGVTYDKQILQFVGPTGVGKTTTIAKVAAESMLKDNKKVAFITADTYRIAAIEQLKTYSKILDVPLEVAYSIEDYKSAVKKFESYDLILVDTAGRNFRDERYIKELQESISFHNDIETYLVLSLTAKPKDILDIYEQFQHLDIREVIFTKTDETTQYGSILNITLLKNVGVAYMTNGQDVPDDIIHPSPEIITDYIVGEYSGS